MQRKATVYRIAPENVAEYRRRHDEIWQELSQAIDTQGVHNYSIWYHDGYLFSYYEVDPALARELSPREREVAAQWDVYMSDILIPVKDEKTGEQVELPLMFYHK